MTIEELMDRAQADFERFEELRDQLSYHTAEQSCMANTCAYCRDHVDALAGLVVLGRDPKHATYAATLHRACFAELREAAGR